MCGGWDAACQLPLLGNSMNLTLYYYLIIVHKVWFIFAQFIFIIISTCRSAFCVIVVATQHLRCHLDSAKDNYYVQVIVALLRRDRIKYHIFVITSKP